MRKLMCFLLAVSMVGCLAVEPEGAESVPNVDRGAEYTDPCITSLCVDYPTAERLHDAVAPSFNGAAPPWASLSDNEKEVWRNALEKFLTVQ